MSPYYNGRPKKAVNTVGFDLIKTINYIEHSEFFVGLSSGLAWLAHALGKRAAMISNFTEDWYEFDINCEDYVRFTDKTVCHGCWNRMPPNFSIRGLDWYWCPDQAGTPRQFECHKVITPDVVFDGIKKWL